MTTDIIVLGSGPAGSAAALGLVVLGYRVTVVCLPRHFRACEGLSEATVQGLRRAGCVRAVNTLGAFSARTVRWNGETSQKNREVLVDRHVLDAALIKDLQASDIPMVHGRGKVIRGEDEDGVRVRVTPDNGAKQILQGRFLVDARGRSGPAGGAPKVRGPETVGLLQRWQGPPVPPRSAVSSFRDGWAWVAALPEGTRYLQISQAGDPEALPKKDQMAAHLRQRIAVLSTVNWCLEDATPVAQVDVRTSTARMSEPLIGDAFIRLGDTAVAPDPLSGNGVFHALSTALVAPAVINTLLNFPEQAEIAKAFYTSRIREACLRFARVGRDFYAMERQWPEEPFWRDRREWPDHEPAHAPHRPEKVQVETRPVVDHARIVDREVVVTEDHPLGIWQLDGVPLAPVVRRVQSQKPSSPQDCLALIESAVEATPDQSVMLLEWLKSRQLVCV